MLFQRLHGPIINGSGAAGCVILCKVGVRIQRRSLITSLLSTHRKINNQLTLRLAENCYCYFSVVQHVWNVMAHAQKPDLVFQRNGLFHLNWRGGSWGGGQFTRLLVAEVCASAVVMLDTPCSEVECKTTGYPLHSHVSPSLPLPCVIVCHQVSTELYNWRRNKKCGDTESSFSIFCGPCIVILWYTGRFKMYSGITKIYYRKTVRHVFKKPVQTEGTTQFFFQ